MKVDPCLPLTGSTLPPNAPFVAVSFEESECITRVGSTTTTYLVLVDRTWLPVQRVAAAITRSMASCPGVVWRRIVELTLPVGTEVERVIDCPQRGLHVSTSDLLFGRSHGLRRNRQRVRLVVAHNGQLRAPGLQQ